MNVMQTVLLGLPLEGAHDLPFELAEPRCVDMTRWRVRMPYLSAAELQAGWHLDLYAEKATIPWTIWYSLNVPGGVSAWKHSSCRPPYCLDHPLRTTGGGRQGLQAAPLGTGERCASSQTWRPGAQAATRSCSLTVPPYNRTRCALAAAIAAQVPAFASTRPSP
eukprot:scaffold3121_cov365-Prasinococcus_capsulatus_cf.AAC.6